VRRGEKHLLERGKSRIKGIDGGFLPKVMSRKKKKRAVKILSLTGYLGTVNDKKRVTQRGSKPKGNITAHQRGNDSFKKNVRRNVVRKKHRFFSRGDAKVKKEKGTETSYGATGVHGSDRWQGGLSWPLEMAGHVGQKKNEAQCEDYFRSWKTGV